MTFHGLGLLPDPADARGNWDASERLSAPWLVVPERVHWLQHIDWIRDQGNSNACVGFAFARAIQLSRRAQDNPFFEMPSALHIYDVTRGVQGRAWIDREQEWQSDDGASPACAALALERYGFCPEVACPWDERRVRSPLDMHEYINAIQRRDVLCHRVLDGGPTRVEAIRAAIAQGHGGMIGMDVDQSFIEWTDVTPWSGMTGNRLGGHAMAWCGYDPFSLWVVNSWSDDWGDQGIGRIAWSVIAGQNTRSVWVIDSVPSVLSQRS